MLFDFLLMLEDQGKCDKVSEDNTDLFLCGREDSLFE